MPEFKVSASQIIKIGIKLNNILFVRLLLHVHDLSFDEAAFDRESINSIPCLLHTTQHLKDGMVCHIAPQQILYVIHEQLTVTAL